MQKIFYFLLLVLFSFQLCHAEQPHSLFISPKYVKNSKLKTRNASNKGDSDSKIYASITPKVQEGCWPDFCLKHLQNDPAGCSAWSEDLNGNLQLDFLLSGSSETQIAVELIERLGPLCKLIPLRKKGAKRACDYAWCPNCSQTVIRGICCYEVEDDEDDNVYNDIYLTIYKCACTGQWWLDLQNLDEEDFLIFDDWKFCCAPTIYCGYFDWHNQTYFRHLKNFLLYQQENPSCSCYWPQIESSAKDVSDHVYNRLIQGFEDSNFDPRLSFTPYLTERTLHGFFSGLLVHSFFYSQYREVLLDLDQHSFKESKPNDYNLIHDHLSCIEESIQTPLLKLYNQCIHKHPHPKIFYERGMILFHRGENLDAIEDIRKFISYAENHHYNEFLTSDLYLKEGRLLSESLSYDEAIIALTKAIEKDSKNKEAYFERAIAYFETGDFSKALSDYLASGIKPKKIDPRKVGKLNSITFGQGIALGMIHGGQESVTEFVPSLLSSFRGIGRGIWAFVSHPIEVSQDMVECAYACLEFIKDKTSKEMLCKLVPELQECIKKWSQLDDYTKGQTIGHVIGKYGVDIFIGSGSVKAIQLYRDLRKANALMTLETASLSPKFTQEILEQANIQQQVRKTILKGDNLKIQWDKQGKHIPGHKNYVPEKNKSIFTHENPQKLIETFAGKGLKDSSQIPGKAGYKEIVDFGELIGYDVHPGTGQMTPTTWGKIHYSKDGVHIVPSRPR